MIYQHPLAYLIGLEGLALLRAFCGEHDREFVEARLADIRVLWDAVEELGEGGTAAEGSTMDGYDAWAAFYDHQVNGLIDLEQPIVRGILDDLPIGVALDAACGTGRHAAHLKSLGHQVIGVDSSPGMLAVARTKVPDGTFVEGDLVPLPVPDEHVDLVVCSLALNHVEDLGPVMAEFARVLRPGGHLVLSDSRGIAGIGLPLVQTAADGTSTYMPNRVHPTSDYLVAALPLGFQVRQCVEPRRPEPFVGEDGVPPGAGTDPKLVRGAPPNYWSLMAWASTVTRRAGLSNAADAANAALRGTPGAIIWHFQRAAP